jgi:hypothetical protein
MIGGGTRTTPHIMPLAGWLGIAGGQPRGLSPFFGGRIPLPPAPPLVISGVTKDETGAATDGFTVYLFNMNGGAPRLADMTVSANGGQYSFTVGQNQTYWAVSYKSGSPDKTGATLQTLTGA